MNSLQLISKLKTKSEDLRHALQQVLSTGSSFNSIEKELLKKNCVELYELILKLKTDAELTEEKPDTKPFYNNLFAEEKKEIKPTIGEELKIETPIFENKLIETIEHEPAKPIVNFVAPNTFNEVIKQVDVEEETLNSLQEKTASMRVDFDDLPEVEFKPTENNHINFAPIDLNLERAIENKRIQKTVMPDPETKPKPSLNDLVKAKELTYNEKLAQKIEVVSPFVERTIEQPVDSMKSEINLNKKIAFVNELFSENVVEYAKAIDKLNSANGLNDALRIFSEYKHQFNWQTNHELVVELERIIKRRHPSA